MRHPQSIPFECFGFEYEPEDAVCQKCAHKTSCIPAMGRRANRVPLSKATFDFVPEAIDSLSIEDTERQDYAEIFNVCHEKIFGKRPHFKSPFYKIADPENRLESVARDNRCSVKTFITCSMLGFQLANPDRQFYPKFLFGESARRRIDMYREEVIRRFGEFDADSMEDFMYGERSGDTEQKLLSSEVMAGSWIVGYKIKFGGDPFYDFICQNEFKLSPLWLAVEARYVPIFQAHLKNPTGSAMLKKHRHSVSTVMRGLKTSKGNKWSRARYLFQCREKIMPQALKTVLEYRRFTPEDFEIENKPVTDSIKMWSRLGLALQHLRCLQMARK